jgi:transcriptional regulator with XRE-family HTH domain
MPFIPEHGSQEEYNKPKPNEGEGENVVFSHAEQQASERLGKPPPLAAPANPALETPHRQERRSGRPRFPLESTLTGDFFQGSLIRKLREEKGLTMKDTAAQVGYHLASLYDLERNRMVPSQEKLQRIAELLDVPIAVLEQAPQHPRQPRRGRRTVAPERTSSGELYLGSLIRKLRQEKRLPTTEMESQIGYARRSLSVIERNRMVPSQEKLQRIAELLDVPVTELKQAPVHSRIPAHRSAEGMVKP